MTQPKKPWTEPELIVIVRNKPEESVLAGCKVNPGDDGPATAANACTGIAGDCLVDASS